jgi:BirA family biotin operon repressor/biotin-[acetyl-CoA-carboxylase] ligase
LFSLQKFRSYLSTKVFGHNIVFYEKIGSTNDEARRFARKGKPEGFLVLSDRQTSGKGRFRRTWYSPGKTGLYCSLILRPPIPLSKISPLTILAGVAVLKTIQNETSLTPLLKWPNDLLINGKKVCGILIESAPKKNNVEFAILGIGININNNEGQFPDDLSSSSTSLKIEGGKDINRERFLSSLMFYLEKDYIGCLNEDNKGTLQFWRQHNDTLGKKVTVNQGKRLITGLAKDIDETGNLLIQLDNGNMEKVSSGELE